MPKIALMPRAMKNSMLNAMQSIGAEFIRAEKESRQALLSARGGTPIGQYDHWRKEHFRLYDPAGFDQVARRGIAPVTFHVIIREASVGKISIEKSRLLRSLFAQDSQSWCCYLLSEAASLSRLATGASYNKLERAPAFWCVLRPDDELPPYALSALSAEAARSPKAKVIYADEECIFDRKYQAPAFKPCWSPIFEANRPYLGRAVFWRDSMVEHTTNESSIEVTPEFETEAWRRSALSLLPAEEIAQLRRVVLTKTKLDIAERSSQPHVPALPRRNLARVNIIIPTKNAFELISACLEGVYSIQDHLSFDVTLVDNGSTDTQVLALYASYAARENFRVIKMPGKFNYARMCNIGFEQTQGDVLLFLNNDMSMPNSTWLAPLVDWAMQPDVGVVGAKLLFPKGTLQHAGVTIGMGGYAAHHYHDAPPAEPGYLDRLTVSHELSAVTGACQAIERSKFDKIGRFNEIEYPVELNDIDLCLRLNTAGYQTIQCIDSLIVHHQSASRGFSYRPFTRYALERANFKRSWDHVIRDDPYFHPALSLFSSWIALDG